MSDTKDRPAVIWFRDDLRVNDNAALAHAARTGAPVIGIYVQDEQSPHVRKLGGAQKWFLHHALADLQSRLAEHDIDLVLLQGPAEDVVCDFAKELNACEIIWNRRYSPAESDVDSAVASRLGASEMKTSIHNGNLLHEPGSICTNDGGPYRVYSPFKRAFFEAGEPRSPHDIPQFEGGSFSAKNLSDIGCSLEDLALLPGGPDWADGLRETWDATRAGAEQTLREFLAEGLEGYAEGRDRPAGENVSGLSPYLRWGLLSPYEIWHAVAGADAPREDIDKFHAELIWREFCYSLLHHFPRIAEENYNSGFDDFPWRDAPSDLKKWQQGRTGYPIVDAGMRQLWRTGYMHNRIRMVVASFLTKHLLIDWRHGEAWFWDTLVDGDFANNPANWQWVAGSGADAAPYFRIFNPVLQGRKFDSGGEYVRHWVPEIGDLEGDCLHAPWEASGDMLEDAGVELGETYPEPMVVHQEARERALDAYNSIKEER